MSSSQGSTANVQPDLNSEILEFGKHIFAAIGREQPSSFDKNYWSGRIMEWSMTKPEFKVNLFRLVDVLPTLRSSEAIARHVNEYLAKPGAEISGLLEWGLDVNPRSLRAKATAMVVKKTVRQVAAQYIAGETPADALKPIRNLRKRNMAFTVDLLGEFCVSEVEADAYLQRYMEALDVFGREVPKWKAAAPIIDGNPGELSPICISVKLSALYSQTSVLNFEHSVEVISKHLETIARKAKQVNGLIYVDAEDVNNNVIIYEVFKRVFLSSEFRDFPYPGIVLQAYARDSDQRLDDLINFAKQRGAPIAVRLVKGAYWDYETISSHQHHWHSPLFSKKQSSDAQYEKLSRVMIDNYQHLLPAFGSHNIRSLCHAICYARSKKLTNKDYELQMLYGMADPIAQAFTADDHLVRLYVPLGDMIPGMGYLVRRLLENTSNESFLRHTFYDESEVENLLQQPAFDPSDQLKSNGGG